MRWLRSDYQIAKGRLTKLPTVTTAKPEQFEARLRDATARKPGFPRDATDHTAAGQATLEALERLGHVAGTDGGYLLRRAA